MKLLTLSLFLLASMQVSFASGGKHKGHHDKKGKDKMGCRSEIMKICGERKGIKKDKEARMAWRKCKMEAIPKLSEKCQAKMKEKMAKRKGKMGEKLSKLKSKLEGTENPEMKAKIQKKIDKISERMNLK